METPQRRLLVGADSLPDPKGKARRGGKAGQTGAVRSGSCGARVSRRRRAAARDLSLGSREGTPPARRAGHARGLPLSLAAWSPLQVSLVLGGQWRSPGLSPKPPMPLPTLRKSLDPPGLVTSDYMALIAGPASLAARSWQVLSRRRRRVAAAADVRAMSSFTLVPPTAAAPPSASFGIGPALPAAGPAATRGRTPTTVCTPTGPLLVEVEIPLRRLLSAKSTPALSLPTQRVSHGRALCRGSVAALLAARRLPRPASRHPVPHPIQELNT